MIAASIFHNHAETNHGGSSGGGGGRGPSPRDASSSASTAASASAHISRTWPRKPEHAAYRQRLDQANEQPEAHAATGERHNDLRDDHRGQ